MLFNFIVSLVITIIIRYTSVYIDGKKLAITQLILCYTVILILFIVIDIFNTLN